MIKLANDNEYANLSELMMDMATNENLKGFAVLTLEGGLIEYYEVKKLSMQKGDEAFVPMFGASGVSDSDLAICTNLRTSDEMKFDLLASLRRSSSKHLTAHSIMTNPSFINGKIYYSEDSIIYEITG